jgi:dTMP kinase
MVIDGSQRQFFGHGLPYTEVKSLSGTLITLEGTDGVGRSTQVALLKEWLEVQGYGVMETGWTRSELMSETIGTAKAGHNLNQLTLSLLYATDFADRLEKLIIPALRSGFVVIADRYMYTAFARSVVRGADPRWIRSVFGFALVPHLVLYLKLGVNQLVPRVLKGRGMDYWESGMDVNLGTDPYESFQKYQRQIIREYNRMAREFSFATLDASQPIAVIQERIRSRVRVLLEARKVQAMSEGLETFRPLLFESSPERPRSGMDTAAGARGITLVSPPGS